MLIVDGIDIDLFVLGEQLYAVSRVRKGQHSIFVIVAFFIIVVPQSCKVLLEKLLSQVFSLETLPFLNCCYNAAAVQFAGLKGDVLGCIFIVGSVVSFQSSYNN